MGITQSFARRVRPWVSVLLPAGVALWGSGWGCGGVVTDSGAGRDGGSERKNPGMTVPGYVPTCGNGFLDDGEQCDGTLFRSGLSSCMEATMGSFPTGNLSCSSACGVIMTGCYQGGSGGRPAGAGGKPPIGGTFGAGGQGAQGGTFGFPSTPANDCYAQGGVPDPFSGLSCSFGVDAANACLKQRSTQSCADNCGCSQCPNSYDHCESDFGCAWIFGCAQQMQCYSLKACYAQGCNYLIDSTGGPSSASAVLADQTLSCFTQSSCPLACPPPL